MYNFNINHGHKIWTILIKLRTFENKYLIKSNPIQKDFIIILEVQHGAPYVVY
jgi:hypothetical protein